MADEQESTKNFEIKPLPAGSVVCPSRPSRAGITPTHFASLVRQCADIGGGKFFVPNTSPKSLSGGLGGVCLGAKAFGWTVRRASVEGGTEVTVMPNGSAQTGGAA